MYSLYSLFFCLAYIAVYFKVALKNFLILPGILNKNIWKIWEFSKGIFFCKIFSKHPTDITLLFSLRI